MTFFKPPWASGVQQTDIVNGVDIDARGFTAIVATVEPGVAFLATNHIDPNIDQFWLFRRLAFLLIHIEQPHPI